MKNLIFIIFLLPLFVSAQKVPSPYPLYNILEVKGIYANRPYFDTTLSILVYDSLHRLSVQKNYSIKNGQREIISMKECSYDSGGAYMFAVNSDYISSKGIFVKDNAIGARYNAIGAPVYMNSGAYYNSILVYGLFNSYKYDSSGRTVMYSSLDTMQQTGEKHKYLYSASGMLLADTQFNWNSKARNWGRQFLEFWIKNKSDSDSIHVLQSWDGKKWANIGMFKYYYDSLSRKVKILSLYGSNSGDFWTMESRDSFLYDSTGWIDYQDYWSIYDKKWGKDSRINHTGSVDTFCFMRYNWDAAGNSYESPLDIFPECYQYDKYGKLLSHYSDDAFHYFSWKYDSLERISHYNFHDISNADDIWYYYYPRYSGIESPEQGLSNIQLYPNPSKGIYNINFTENFTGELIVYDMLGKIRFRQNINGQEKASFELSAPAGIYLLKLEDKDGNFATMKLIKY